MVSPSNALPRSGDKQRFVQEMFDRIAPRYDLVNSVMTFGLDRRWRRLAVGSLTPALAPGSRVLDLASGPGEICDILRRAGFHPVGMDLSWGMLAARSPGGSCHDGATGSLSRAGDRVQGDAGILPFVDGAIDGITCGFGLRNFVDLDVVFAEARRVLRPGGRMALLEVSVPRNKILKIGHQAYFRHLVPWIGAVLSDGPAYRYLPESVAYLPDAAALSAQLYRAGFEAVTVRQLAGGATQLVSATRS